METTYDLISMIAMTCVVIGLGGFALIVHKMTQAKKQDDYLMNMYRCVWTGHPLDRVHAWFRVIQHLRAWNHDPELLHRARILMQQEKQRPAREDVGGNAWMVNGKGEIIKGTISDHRLH